MNNDISRCNNVLCPKKDNCERWVHLEKLDYGTPVTCFEHLYGCDFYRPIKKDK